MNGKYVSRTRVKNLLLKERMTRYLHAVDNVETVRLGEYEKCGIVSCPEAARWGVYSAGSGSRIESRETS